MNPQLETKLRRIQTISNVLRGACTGFLLLSVFIYLAAAISSFAGWSVVLTYFSQSIPVASLAPLSRVVVGVVALLTGVVAVNALHHLRCLFGNFMRREIFTTGSARHLRQFGIGCVLWGIVKIVWAFLPLLVPGHSSHPIGLNSDAIVIGAVIVAVSWLAEMGSAIREENELTI